MTRAVLVGLVVCIPGGVCAAPVPKADDPDKLAVAATEALIKALKARDGDALVKLCDVPFRADNKKITDKDELAKELARMAADSKVPDLTVSVKEVMTVAKFAEFFEKERKRKPTDEQVKDLTGLVGEGGRVVLLKVEKAGKVQDRTPGVAVRVKDGAAKVVGLLD